MHAQILPSLSGLLPPLDEDNRKRLKAIRSKVKKQGRRDDIVTEVTKGDKVKARDFNDEENLIDSILDAEKREGEFEASLQFLNKVLITDDGDLISQSRVILPETVIITDNKEEFKKKR